MKNPHQEQDLERIKKPTQRSREKTSTNPVVAAAWSLRHLGSIATASFAVAASLVWFFCLRGLGFVLCGFLFGIQGFWVRGLGFILRIWVSRFLGIWVLFFVVWVLFFVISGFQGRRLWVWLRRCASLLFSLFFFFWFCVCYFAWCLMIVGVWVVRKCGKAKGFSGFVYLFIYFWVC